MNAYPKVKEKVPIATLVVISQTQTRMNGLACSHKTKHHTRDNALCFLVTQIKCDVNLLQNLVLAYC